MTDPRDESTDEPVEPGEHAASPPPLTDNAPLSPDDEPRDEVAHSDPRLLEPGAIRAWRRPRAVALLWAWQLLCSIFLATPIHAWAKAVWGSHPDGDAVLFRPGGYALLAWLTDNSHALSVVVRTTLFAIAVFGVLGQIITGAVIASLASGSGARERPASMYFAVRAGAAAFFPLTATSIVFGAIQGSAVAVGLLAGAEVERALIASMGDAAAFRAHVVVVLLFVLAALATGIVADLARVAIVRDVVRTGEQRSSTRQYLVDGIVAALRTARGTFGRASVAWGWRAALSLALVYIAARTSDIVGAGEGGALQLLFVFHQVVVFARAGLRTSWLATSLRLVGNAEPKHEPALQG
jgi:hypothetical protein